jgi:hypothetical protein
MVTTVALYARPVIVLGEQCTTGAFTLIGAQEGAENGCPQRAAFVAEKTATAQDGRLQACSRDHA